LTSCIGVGGHCLPKDGILLLWRWIESGQDISRSLILEARSINDESPREAHKLMTSGFGDLAGRKVTLLGMAYKKDSMDTRNSPSLELARLLLDHGCDVTLHDPYVKADDTNLCAAGLEEYFTKDWDEAIQAADILVACTAHGIYTELLDDVSAASGQLTGLFDGCHLFSERDPISNDLYYIGIGKGRLSPPEPLVVSILQGYKTVANGFAAEIEAVISFLNEHFADDDFDKVSFSEVKRLAETCVSGCFLGEPGRLEIPSFSNGFASRLVDRVNIHHGLSA
jgi:hypothetical protein